MVRSKRLRGAMRGGVVVVVLRVGRGEREQRRGELRDRADAGQRMAERGADAVAGKAGLGLLVGSERVAEGILQITAGWPLSVVVCGQSLEASVP